MKTFILPDAVIRGDVWLQLLTLTQLARDFTGLTCTPSLWQGDDEISGTVPSGVVTVPYLGQVDILIGLTDDQTQALPAGAYSVRVRVEITGSWGPYTVAELQFLLVL